MTPRQRQRQVEAEVFRVALALFVGGWLAVDPWPMLNLGWFALVVLAFMVGAYHEMKGRDTPR